MSTNWRKTDQAPSLVEVFHSIPTKHINVPWRKLLAFLGPGYLVAVGYMDPGNWATSLAGGAKFGYALLAVALLSNLMAIILQSLCIRLGIGAQRDLAQACRDGLPRFFSFPLWIMAEIAICATDLAEVIGTAIALDLLFGIPLQIGVFITAADVFLILWLQSKGFRKIEALIMVFLAVITVCFIAQIALADPDWQGVFKGFIPHTTIFTNPEMLYLALGIIGATVMPHNLYLHSAIVQTRAIDNTDKAKKEAIRYATYDSTFALCLALIINAAILILAASSFHLSGHHDIATIEEAHGLLTPLLGSTLAPILFGVALLCCGLSSTVTATMAGQVVMEGFINWRIQPWLRRLITRAVAIVPAAAVTIYFGATGTGKLLILSQVILSLQLPFAIVPLIYFTADRRKMGAHTAPRLLTLIATLIACVIIGLNMKMLGDYFFG